MTWQETLTKVMRLNRPMRITDIAHKAAAVLNKDYRTCYRSLSYILGQNRGKRFEKTGRGKYRRTV